MRVVLTFPRQEIAALAAELEAAESYTPTMEQMYDPEFRIDGREPSLDETVSAQDVDPDKLEPGLLLVADRGVYLIGNHQRPAKTPPTISYAKQADPNKLPPEEWDPVRTSVFDGDDGTLLLPLQAINAWLQSTQEEISLALRDDSIEFLG